MPISRLNVVQDGTSAAVLRLALRCEPRKVLVNHDPLAIGPLPTVEGIGPWRDVRADFWRRTFDGEPPPRYFRWSLLKHLPALRRATSVHLWLGTCVADQLLLPWMVNLFRLAGIPLPDVSIVQFEQLPGRKRPTDILGLGMLSPPMVKAHPPARRLSRDNVTHLGRIWAALTAPRPDLLLERIADGPAGFPLLKRALRTTLDRFPERRSELSQWDVELLRATAAAGPVVVRVIGTVLARSYDVNYQDSPGDWTLFDRLRRLGDARRAEPALRLEPGEPGAYRGWAAHLTKAGEAFLRGERNFVEINGIDEWVAGVHLDSRAGQVWYRDGATIVVAGAD
jgi:hypothetical protein